MLAFGHIMGLKNKDCWTYSILCIVKGKASSFPTTLATKLGLACKVSEDSKVQVIYYVGSIFRKHVLGLPSHGNQA
jgi:hypothetical protein